MKHCERIEFRSFLLRWDYYSERKEHCRIPVGCFSFNLLPKKKKKFHEKSVDFSFYIAHWSYHWFLEDIWCSIVFIFLVFSVYLLRWIMHVCVFINFISCSPITIIYIKKAISHMLPGQSSRESSSRPRLSYNNQGYRAFSR